MKGKGGQNSFKLKKTMSWITVFDSGLKSTEGQREKAIRKARVKRESEKKEKVT